MVLEFKDVNAAARYFAGQLLSASPVISTNDANQDRYKNTIGGELIQQFFTLQDPQAVIGTQKNHKGHKWWGYGEILSEMLNLDPPIMYKYKPELFGKHYDLLEDGRMQYTYSNRFVEYNQFVNLYHRLKENPNSKRAVIDIFTPYDTAPDRQDAPCTTMYHFLHRDGKLNMTVFMRSWDFFGGFKSYDSMLNSFILQGVSSWLGMKPGNLSFYANSLHYYNRDRPQLEALVQEEETHSDKLELGVDKLRMRDFYDELRMVKSIEEAAYNGNVASANAQLQTLQVPLFKEMAEVWIKKNERKS